MEYHNDILHFHLQQSIITYLDYTTRTAPLFQALQVESTA
jgi:hypothetical protein